MQENSRWQTAKKAVQILVNKDVGFVKPTKNQKRNLLVEFAKHNKVIYGRAFDVVKLKGNVDLDDASSIARNLENIILYEIKSSNRTLPEDFEGYFFALTTAELLVAQNLGSNYKFAFVDTTTGNHRELTLQKVFAKAKAIYPTWSIRF